MSNSPGLGEFEQLVTLAVLRLGSDAYGVAIRREIENQTGRSISRGAVYTTLDRLEGKGLLTSERGDHPPPRSGAVRRYYHVEPEGLEAVQEAHLMLRKMWTGLEPLISGGR